jgi:hypothetical protein
LKEKHCVVDEDTVLSRSEENNFRCPCRDSLSRRRETNCYGKSWEIIRRRNTKNLYGESRSRYTNCLETFLNTIHAVTYTVVMIVVYDGKGGDLQGRCCPMSPEKEFSEKKIRKLIHNDRFLVLKSNGLVNQEQQGAIRGFLELAEPPANRPLGYPEGNPGDIIAEKPASGIIYSDRRLQHQ